MKIKFDSSAARGSQYTVEMEDGRVVKDTSQSTILGLLRAAGASVRESQQLIAAAQLEATADPK